MRILFIGDIVASPGRKTVVRVLPEAIKEKSIDFVIANAENVAHGRGISEEALNDLMHAGVNFFTGGDHMFWQRDTEDFIDKYPVVRPANYPGNPPGIGHALVDLGSKGRILIINVMGRLAFGGLTALLDDPFTKTDEILSLYKDSNVTDIIVDFHGDATSEKMAYGFYVDGRVSAVLGTHTHIPTADTLVLPKGTMYVTDAGMTGIIDSVLGVKKEIIIKLQLTAMNQRFEWEDTGRKAFRSVILDTQAKTIERFDKVL